MLVKRVGRAMPGMSSQTRRGADCLERVACRGIRAVLAAGRTGGGGGDMRIGPIPVERH